MTSWYKSAQSKNYVLNGKQYVSWKSVNRPMEIRGFSCTPESQWASAVLFNVYIKDNYWGDAESFIDAVKIALDADRQVRFGSYSDGVVVDDLSAEEEAVVKQVWSTAPNGFETTVEKLKATPIMPYGESYNEAKTAKNRWTIFRESGEVKIWYYQYPNGKIATVKRND